MQIDTRNRSEFNDLDPKEKINSLQKLRLQFYAEDEDSEKVDELRDEIQRLISENFEVLPFDFILVHRCV
jgi:protein-arginine kinase activator protein McsA